jgi:hypothetical protein
MVAGYRITDHRRNYDIREELGQDIIMNGTTARVGPWPPLRVFVMVRYLRCGVISPTINLVIVILIRPPETSGSKASRYPVAKQVKHG